MKIKGSLWWLWGLTATISSFCSIFTLFSHFGKLVWIDPVKIQTPPVRNRTIPALWSMEKGNIVSSFWIRKFQIKLVLMIDEAIRGQLGLDENETELWKPSLISKIINLLYDANSTFSNFDHKNNYISINFFQIHIYFLFLTLHISYMQKIFWSNLIRMKFQNRFQKRLYFIFSNYYSLD